ncbi:hypothetical protein LCGC14_0882660 [marine sediment metagenome]|uniref:Ribosomal protein S20 n=1 Tax=marine sediment metagenome TaxID=412755 RepID=A0A0F9S8D7_9ZZZZ
MKRKKAIKHRIEQKTADRKNARARKRLEFRLIAKGQRSILRAQIHKAVTEAKAKA